MVPWRVFGDHKSKSLYKLPNMQSFLVEVLKSSQITYTHEIVLTQKEVPTRPIFWIVF